MEYDDYAARRDARVSGRNQHLRLSINLASSLYHFREHLPPEFSLDFASVETLCPSYRLIRDVTDASKHGVLSRSNTLVAKAEDIRELIVSVFYTDEEGTYPDNCTSIRVKCTDGKTRNLDDALTKVTNFWGNYLREAGVLKFSNRAPPKIPGQNFVPRQEARLNLDFEASRGLDFKVEMILLEFDNSKGSAAPMNLEGATFEGTISRTPLD